MVGRMSVSSTHGPGKWLSATTVWPLFAPAEDGPSLALGPSMPSCFTPGPTKPT